MDPYGLSGKHLGPFEVLECVGQGGMAIVYRGLQPSVGNREVALKIARPELGPEFLKRFSLEAANAGALHHENIVPVYAAGEALGYQYIAMRFVRGPRLEDMLVSSFGQPLDTHYALQVLSQVAKALDYSHACGVVHRDINPRNIMLETGSDHRAYVTDFGIAIAVQDAATRLTMPGTHVGTLEYMAPEQYDPKRFGPVGPGADIWALAVLSYRMLTGWLPFEVEGASMVALALKVAQHSPVPPSRLNPRLGSAVDEVICERGLAKSPASRPASCAEFVAAVEKALLARPTVTSARSKWVLAIALGSALVLLAVTLSIISGAYHGRGSGARGGAISRTVSAQDAPQPPKRAVEPESVPNSEQASAAGSSHGRLPAEPAGGQGAALLGQQGSPSRQAMAPRAPVRRQKPRWRMRYRAKPAAIAHRPRVPPAAASTKPSGGGAPKKPSGGGITNVDQ